MTSSSHRHGRIGRRAFGATALVALAACAGGCSKRPIPRARALPSIASSAPPRSGAAPDLAAGPSAPPLFDAFPELAERLPYVALGAFPTPIVRAESLGAELRIPELYLKRDDVSGEFGGGKTRKLEMLLGEALDAGSSRVETSGSVGSNHAAATAVYARRTGLRAKLLLLPEPAGEHVRHNLRLMIACGAELELVGHAGLARAERDAREARGTIWIPAGGTSALGNVGFVNAAFELARQIDRGAMPVPDVVYVALGTMGSVAGLAVGLAAAGLKRTRIVAVRASSPATSSEPRLRAMIAETSAFLRARAPSFPDGATAGIDVMANGARMRSVSGGAAVGASDLAAEGADIRIDGVRPRAVSEDAKANADVTIDTRHLGDGYALPTARALDAIDRARRLEGLTLETTYTGKALAALIDHREALRHQVVLFWCSNDTCSPRASNVDDSGVPPALRGWL